MWALIQDGNDSGSGVVLRRFAKDRTSDDSFRLGSPRSVKTLTGHQSGPSHHYCTTLHNHLVEDGTCGKQDCDMHQGFEQEDTSSNPT